MKQALLIVVALISPAILSAQTIAPVHAEHSTKVGKTVHGSYQVQNDGLTPEPLTIEADGLEFNAQGPRRVALPVTTKITLSATSMRLGPKQIVQIDYRITCSVEPCAVALSNIFTLGKVQSGLEVRAIIPFPVYVCSTSKHCRADTLHAAGLDALVAKK